MNNYHQNINLTIEINPKKLLDTQVILKNGKLEIVVYRKSTKLPVPWSSNIPKRYKRNTINAGLHRSKRISTNFETFKEVYQIKKKFLAVVYPQSVLKVLSVVFENDKIEIVEVDYIIQTGFFDIAKPVIIAEVSFSPKQFMRKFHNFAGTKFDLRIKRITRNMEALFKLKDKCLHPACKIYHGVCSCGKNLYRRNS